MHETAPSLTTVPAAAGPATDVVLRWVTILTVALIPVAFVFGALAGMATTTPGGSVKLSMTIKNNNTYDVWFVYQTIEP
ncbi:hypothetical protein ABZ281_47040, partial [Streptomyces sp. NPDC006265]